MIGLLVKAVHARPMKKKQVGPHRYTDPQGRVWDWDPVAKKYIYIPKAPQTSTASLSDKDKRNQAIIDDYQLGMSLKDLAAKYKLSNARVYGITRGKSSTTTKLKAGKIVGNERTAAYNAAPTDAQTIADNVGVLPVGKSSLAYVKANLQSIFKASPKEVQYLKGVNADEPLGGLGAWMVDDSLVDTAIVALEESIKEIQDSGTDYWKSLEGMDRDAIKKAMENHLKHLQQIVKDRGVLDAIHEIVGDKDDTQPLDMSKMGWFPIAWSAPECLFAAAISPDDIEATMEENAIIAGRFGEFVDALGMTTEGWKKRNWNQEEVYGVLMACMFPEELDGMMDRWLTPHKYTKKSGGGTDEEVVTGGQGNEYPIHGTIDADTPEKVLAPAYQVNRTGYQGRNKALLPEDERWTIEDFRKGVKKVQKLFPEMHAFLRDNFKFDPDTLKNDVELNKNAYSDSWKRKSEELYLGNGTTVKAISGYYRKYTKLEDTILNSFKAVEPGSKAPAATTMLRSFQKAFDANIEPYGKNVSFRTNENSGETFKRANMELWRDRIVEGVGKNIEMWKKLDPNTDVSSGHVLDQLKLFRDLKSKASKEMQDVIEVTTLGPGTQADSVFRNRPAQAMIQFSNKDPVQAAANFPDFDPISLKVDKVYPGGYGGGRRYGGRRGGGGYTGTEHKSMRKDYSIAKRAALKTAHKDNWIHYGHGQGKDSIRDFFIYSLGANYHARKMIKHYKGATKFVWPQGKPMESFWGSSKQESEETYRDSVTAARASMLTRQITRGKGGAVTGQPDAMLSDVPLDEYKRIAAKVQADHDLGAHAGFRIKINGIYKINSKMERAFQEASKTYGNVKKELYHGTSFMSGVPIMRGGFKIIKGHTATGRRVWRAMGDGIYLADQSSKSAQYIGGDFSRSGTHGVLFLNDVAMGKVGDQYDAGVNTVFGAKGTRWVNNEWAVKDPKAVIPRYWIDVESV
jgi:hypothetical protein